MRLYAPKSEALTGKWNPLPILKSEGKPPVTTKLPIGDVLSLQNGIAITSEKDSKMTI